MEPRMPAYMSALFNKTKHKLETELQHRLCMDFRPGRYISVGIVQSLHQIPRTQNVRDARKCENPLRKAKRIRRFVKDGTKLNIHGILSKPDACMFAFLHALAEARRYLKGRKEVSDQTRASRVRLFSDYEPGVREFEDFFALTSQREVSEQYKYKQEISHKVQRTRQLRRRALLRSVWRMLKRVTNLGACVYVEYTSAGKDRVMATAKKLSRQQGRQSYRDKMAEFERRVLSGQTAT